MSPVALPIPAARSRELASLARRERWGYSYVAVQGPVAHELAPIVAALTGT